MKTQVNLSQVLQGGLAALVGWLFKTVNDLQQEVAVLMVQITDAKDDLISLAMREQELNSAITEILINATIFVVVVSCIVITEHRLALNS